MAVTAREEVSFPNLSPGMMQEYEVTEEEWTAYDETFGPEARPVHRIAGHPGEIQGDLRLRAQLVSNGIYCGNAKGYKEGRDRGLEAGAKDWRLLLQADSDEDAGMMWGDLGRLYFMIHEDDAKRHNFDRVWLILQCS